MSFHLERSGGVVKRQLDHSHQHLNKDELDEYGLPAIRRVTKNGITVACLNSGSGHMYTAFQEVNPPIAIPAHDVLIVADVEGFPELNDQMVNQFGFGVDLINDPLPVHLGIKNDTDEPVWLHKVFFQYIIKYKEKRTYGL